MPAAPGSACALRRHRFAHCSADAGNTPQRSRILRCEVIHSGSPTRARPTPKPMKPHPNLTPRDLAIVADFPSLLRSHQDSHAGSAHPHAEPARAAAWRGPQYPLNCGERLALNAATASRWSSVLAATPIGLVTDSSAVRKSMRKPW